MKSQEIRLRIHDESELFSPYDPDQKLLSEDVASYLERNYLNKHRSALEQYTLQICGDVPVHEESVTARLREYFSHERDNVSYAIQKLTVKQVWLAIFGFAVLALWWFLSEHSDHTGVVRLEILSIIGWVAIWEAASITIMERPELVALRRSYERIINARIVFDAPYK